MRAKHTTMETRRFTKKAARGKKKRGNYKTARKKMTLVNPNLAEGRK